MPGEGLLDLATRFDNMAIPLLNAHLTTERDLALVLRKHIPVFFCKKTFAKMETQDDKRRIRGEDPSTRQKMIAIAREVEMNIIEHEAEMRKCGEMPPPRSTDPCSNEAPTPDNAVAELGGDVRPKRPMADRLGERVLLKIVWEVESWISAPPKIGDAIGAKRRGTSLGTAPTHEK